MLTAKERSTRPNLLNTGFRLGDENALQASDSESDQSALSVQSISPERKHIPSARKRKYRKTAGALTETLGKLVVSTLNEPQTHSATTVGTPPVDAAQMQVDDVQKARKMSKRTRQNLKKTEARRSRQREQCTNSVFNNDISETEIAQRHGLEVAGCHTQAQPITSRRADTNQKVREKLKRGKELRKARKKEKRNGRRKRQSEERMDID